MTVSVVVPVRNGSRWLPECLASLAKQQQIDFELVVVDDGSTDGSLAVAQRHWDALQQPGPLRCLEAAAAGASRGVSVARNLGWQRASHPLVAFLDADDLALPHRLALQAEALNADPDLAHVMGGWRRFGQAGLEQGHDVRPWLEGAGFDLEPAFRLKAVLPSAWMVRRSALEAVGGFQDGLSQAEDVDLLLRLALGGHRGRWVREVLCGYRVHGCGASHNLEAQSRSLLWVMHQRLAQVPVEHPLAARKQELVFATRAWCAWQAWQAGEGDLALSLWQSSWGMSPLGPARTWLHLAEGIASHSRRIGEPFGAADLLADPHWQAFERFVLAWLEHLAQAPPPLPPEQPTTLQQAWSLLAFGHHQRGLWCLRQQLVDALDGLHDQALMPAELQRWLVPEPRGNGPSNDLGQLRTRAVAWLEHLLAWRGEVDAMEPLLDGLQALLCDWGLLLWSHSLTPAVQKLELAFALKPSAWLLEGLADLQASSAPTGSAALRQLGRQLGRRLGERDATAMQPWPRQRPLPPLGRCSGPSCLDCGPVEPDLSTSETETGFTITELAGGRAWLRPGSWSPWATTTQVAVFDGSGERQHGLCRRYPQPWSGCRQRASWAERPDPAWDCPHPGPALQVEGAVLAVADLSAEVHYHWLLDQLPRLGLALAWWQDHHPNKPLAIWCNGLGPERQRLLESLMEPLGLGRPRWIAAESAPFIQAEQLLVPPFLHPFGEPGQRAIGWLRHTFLGAPDAQARGGNGMGPVLWLSRGAGRRRPAIGEGEAIAALQRRGLPVSAIDLAALPLAEQARTVAAARAIVAPHGGAMANLVFAAPGTPVLELHAPDYAPPYWSSIAAALNLPLQRLASRRHVPELYLELVFGSPLDAPILLEPDVVADAVVEFLEDCSPGPAGGTP